MTSDECAKNLEKWVMSIEAENESNLNEATTRLRYIDHLFQDCLNWDSKNIITEERVEHNSNYVDYVFMAPRRSLILEAKREGVHFEIPASTNDRILYSLPHLLEGSSSLKAAVEQVFAYCTQKGVQLAAVSNGHQLVIFIASRTDGTEPLSGNALVFRSPHIMKQNFLQLWQALSSDGIRAGGLQKILSDFDLNISELPLKLKNFLSDEYPTIMRKSEFQQDLENLSELLFEEVITEPVIEEEFLRACYCQSKYLSDFTLQSKRILESRYSRLTLLGVNIKELSTLGTSLLDPKNIKSITTRKPILLVGDVNVGKTSFIRNLIKIEAPELFSRFLNIYIDFQTQANLEEDIGLFVKREITTQLRDIYKIDIEDRNFVRGVYREDLKNLTKTIYADLKKVNPNRLIEKEIQFLEQKIGDNVAHLKKALSHLIDKKRQVVIFLDNADQRNDYEQEKTFLIGQELARDYGITVFISLRPETFEKLKKKGLLAGYYSRIFTIRPPALRDVVRKRLEFIIRLATGELPIRSLLSDSIKLENIVKLIKIFIFSFESDRKIPECIENISSGNVAVALTIMRDFFSNPHVPHEKILSDAERKGYIMPFFYLTQSIIFKKYRSFYPQDSYVLNIFDISTNNCNEYFIILNTLSILKQSTAEDGFEKISDLYNKLQDFGFLPKQIDYSIEKLLSGGLMEAIFSLNNLDTQRRIRITEKGIYHLERLAWDFSYFDAMIVDTPILDDNTRAVVSEVNNIAQRLERAKVFCEYLDKIWASLNPSFTMLQWNKYSDKLKEEIQRIERNATFKKER